MWRFTPSSLSSWASVCGSSFVTEKVEPTSLMAWTIEPAKPSDDITAGATNDDLRTVLLLQLKARGNMSKEEIYAFMAFFGLEQ
jgi:hypothetical protein